ncbi:tryparedoxin-like protein [Lotmaria passim]
MAPLFDSKAVELLRKEGTVAAAEALIGKKYIMLYFSAHWCPPCRSFTPILKDFYARNKERSSFEIIFVSRDNTAEELRSYFDTAHGDWLALSYRDAQTVGEGWAKQYGIYAIPSLVVLENTEQHPIITSYGRDMVLRDPAALQFPWSNADAIMIAARRSFMWKAAAAGVVGMFFLCFLIR